MNTWRVLFTLVVFLIFSGCSQTLNEFSLSQNGLFSSEEPPPDSENKEGLDGPSDKNVSQNTLPETSANPLGADGNYVQSPKTTEDPKKKQPSLDEALELCQASQDYWQKGELEEAIDALDEAYRLILSIDDSDDIKINQGIEDLRFLISKRILEIYASRHTVANGDHHAIPLVINKHVQAEIDRFTTGVEKQFFRESYIRSGRYRPMITKALKAAGLPEELSWMPLIESGFKVNALSRARALGLWQFIPSTGYKFGLKRNLYIDERLDPYKATHAAINYLKELHQIFGDWNTALAGYNCGENKVLRVIRSQNVNYLDDFWDLYRRLPRETARYVPRFLATLHIVKNPVRYGLDTITVDTPLDFEVVTVAKQVRLRDIAKKIDCTENDLRALNPELRYRLLPKDSYTLRLPPHKGTMLLANLDQIPVSSPPQPAYVYHRVRYGETLSIIAKKYRTSVRRIMRANNMRRSNYIVAGKRLKIPVRSSAKFRSKGRRQTVNRKATFHIVKRGDSLWNIARRYGTTTQKIQQLNAMTDTNLHIGQVLQLRGPSPKPGDGNKYKTYTVQRGDTPYTIARRHNTTLQRFLEINQLAPYSTIYPGQVVYID